MKKNVECHEGGRRSGWDPKGGVVLKQIEFDKRILNELREMARQDGVKSVYQMIRNACFHYVNNRKNSDANADWS